MIATLGRGPGSAPVNVRRTIIGPFRNGSTAASASYAMYFTLNDLFDVTELTSTYDLYRFVKIEVHFRSTTPAIPSAATPPNCYLMASIDLDDSTTPTLNSLSQYERSKVILGHESGSFKFEPRFGEAADAGGNYISTVNIPGKWIDAAYPNVIHRGIKYYISQAAAAAVPAWQIVLVYHIQLCRQR